MPNALIFGATTCTETCIPPATVDVVVGRKRYRLRKDGLSVVWTADIPLPEGSYFFDYAGAAFVKSFRENCLIFVNFTDDLAFPLRSEIWEVNLDDGSVGAAPLADLSDALDTYAWAMLVQESEVTAAFAINPGADHLRSLYTVGPEGFVELMATNDTGGELPFVDIESLGGTCRIGDTLYILFRGSMKIYTTSAGIDPPIIEVDDLSAAFDWTTISKAWMLHDDERDVFYVLGYDHDDHFRLDEWTPGGGSVNLLVDEDDEIAAGAIEFATFAAGQLHWMSAGSEVWEFTIATGSLDLLLRRNEDATWHDLYVDMEIVGANTQRDWLGWGFYVTSDYTCDRTCTCEDEPTPTLTLERVWEEPPGLEDEICEPPAQGACCANFVDGPTQAALNLISCEYRFDYEITLCAGRTLKALVFQGARGVVFINDIDSTDFTEEDWASLPLTGQIRFTFGSATGPQSGALRVTAIDSLDCCTRVVVELECCRCQPAGGGASLASDVYEPAFLDDGWLVLGGTFDTIMYRGPFGCEDRPDDVMQWFELELQEGGPSDCGDLDDGGLEENRICYSIDGDGCERRGGGSLSGLGVPGEVIRFRALLETGGVPTPRCVRVWANDILGGSECRTLVAVIPLVFGDSVVAPGTDISGYTECHAARVKFWTCTEDGGQFFEE